MSDLHDHAGSRGLEDRLRAALGDHGQVGNGGAGRDAPSATKARVLSGIRQRRLRRLQMTGIAAVAVIALAVGLPQVFGGSTPPEGTPGIAGSAANEPGQAHASSNTPARGPSMSPAAQVVTCQAQGQSTAACGDLATGSEVRRLNDALDSLPAATSSSFETAKGSKPFGDVLTVRAGTAVVIDLPSLQKQWAWSTPVVAGAPGFSGSGPPVVVVGTGKVGTAQQFMVNTRVPATVVLEAREDDFTAEKGRNAPMMIPGSAPVWALELKVEGS